MTIAVTGPLASGKSTFVEALGDLGAETVSADEVVHDLLAGDEETIDAVTRRFGKGVHGETGIDRKSLGREVFGDAESLRDLEEILHPRVREETERCREASGADLFVAEIPLLFEGGGAEPYDLTVAVMTPDERRRAWAKERGMGEKQARAIEERQFSGEEKARRADVVVDNDSDLDRLREKARVLMDRVRGERGSGGEGAAKEP